MVDWSEKGAKSFPTMCVESVIVCDNPCNLVRNVEGTECFRIEGVSS